MAQPQVSLRRVDVLAAQIAIASITSCIKTTGNCKLDVTDLVMLTVVAKALDSAEKGAR